MKRVLIIREYKGFGGIEQQIVCTAKALTKSNWEVFFLSNTASPLTEELSTIQGVTVCIHPFEGAWKTAKVIRKLCKENNIPLSQAHMLRESYYCRIAKLLAPTHQHVFRVHTYINCSHIPKWKKKIYHFLGRLTDPLVSRYISINQFNVEEMISCTKINQKKVCVVHDAMRTLSNYPQASKPKPSHIAMVANFVDHKGHDVLIDGIKLLKERGIRIIAHLFGSVPGMGTDSEDNRRLTIIKQHIVESGLSDQVIIEGYSTDISRSLSQISIVVLPSDAEGTPGVLLEAMSLGKVVIASSVGGIPEFITNGVSGFLHPPKDPIAFANALNNALHLSPSDRTTISSEAQKIVSESFSIEQLQHGLDEGLSTLINL